VEFKTEALALAWFSGASSLAIIVCLGKGTWRNRDEIAKLKTSNKTQLRKSYKKNKGKLANVNSGTLIDLYTIEDKTTC
jgi:FtsZ-interacting cell division protein ZipA